VAGKVRFRVLGPVGASVDGHPVPLGPKHRTLLAVLLAHAGHTVSVDRLVDHLWGERPPAAAVNLVRGYVSELRKSLRLERTASADGPALVTRAPGYVLELGPATLDAHQFDLLLRRAADAGDPDRTVALLDEALALWRDDAFADAESTALRRGEGARLDERRLAAVEDRLEAGLGRGRHHELIGELTGLTAAHPFRERLRGQLMLALHRAGRKGDALAVFRETRALLHDELGLEPGTALQRLHDAVLADDPDLELVPEVPAPRYLVPWQVRPDIADFTGRDEAVDTVERLLRGDRHSDNGTTAVVISAIAGKGGVGKTTLAVHVAHRLRAEFPDGQLYVDLQGAGPDPVDAGTALTRFLRALGADDEALPTELDERVALYRATLTDRRVLVLLDNAADEAQLRPLIPAAPTCAVLVTSRSRLATLEGAYPVLLDVLTFDAAVQLLARLAGVDRIHADPAAAAEIVELCGRLPLALRIAGAKLRARPHWDAERLARRLRDERGRLDELSIGDLEVRASLALSYQNAEARHRRAFRLLGLTTAPDFAPWVLAALLDEPLPAAEDLLDELVDQQLLEPAGRDVPGPPRYRFHDLLRVVAREHLASDELPEVRDAARARLLATWLELARAAATGLEGMQGLRLEVETPTAGPTADTALVERAAAAPADWFEAESAGFFAAVEVAHAAAAWDLAVELAVLSVGFHEVQLDWRDRFRALELGLDAAARSGDPRAHAIVTWAIGELHRDRSRLTESMQWLSRALSAFTDLGDRRGEAYTLRALADAERAHGDLDDASAHIRRSIEAFGELGDVLGEAISLGSLALLRWSQGRVRDAVRDFDRCRELLETPSIRTPKSTSEALRWAADLYEDLGEWSLATDCYKNALPSLRAVADHRDIAYAHRGLGIIQAAQGRHHDAARSLDAALSRFREARSSRGEVETVLTAALRYAAADPAVRPPFLGSRRAETRELVRSGMARADQYGETRIAAFAVHALGLLADPPEGLRLLADALRRVRALGQRRDEANVRLSLGDAHLAVGDHAAAATELSAALAMYREFELPYWTARALDRLGELHCRRGDTRYAVEAWQEALALFDRLGAADAERVRDRLGQS
jgi:DNA-binding SARP family transcriptional activator/tetratricopeptide (TPR) repeat protein